ncbi:beta strand repeat-containing protein, partial [Variovorax sp. DT-64]
MSTSSGIESSPLTLEQRKERVYVVATQHASTATWQSENLRPLNASYGFATAVHHRGVTTCQSETLTMNSGLGGTQCNAAHAQHQRKVGRQSSGSTNQGHALPLSAIALAVALVAAMPQQARAANYTASTETELRNAITTANADGDPSSTITLIGDITQMSVFNFPTATKALTINTNGHAISGLDRPATGVPNGTVGGLVGGFNGVTFTNSGALTGGDAEPAVSTGAGGFGLALVNSSLTNNGTITGGRGGTNLANVTAGSGGAGAQVTGGSHVNHGTIRGGSGGLGSTGASSGGTGLSLSNASLVNNGLIEGGASTGSSTIGGSGVVISGATTATLTNTGTIRAGSGGAPATGGNNTRNGVQVNAPNTTIINSGTIEGGNGGKGVGTFSFSGIGNLSIVNSGTIRAGASQANAIEFFTAAGAISVLELHAGSVIEGNVLASAIGVNDTLRLGGAANASFDASAIGNTAQYRDFNIFQKNGTSTWTLTGATTALTPWQILGGTLSVSSDGSLGNAAGALTLDGGTLQSTAAFGSARAVTLNSGGGTFQTDADLSLAGVVDGAGALTKTGAGTLVLSGANTYAGGTTIAGGTVAVSSDGNLGAASGALTFDGGALQNTTSFSSARAVTLNSAGGSFRTDADLGLTSAVAGAGALTKTGSGTLALSGANTYTGSTNIQAGTLALTGAGSIAASGGVAVEGTFDISGLSAAGTSVTGISGSGAVALGAKTLALTAASGDFGGVISGTGGLRVAGGTQRLTGTNTYSGGTSIDGASTLQIGNAGTSGSIVGDVANNGTLVFNRSNRMDVGGAISGSGSIRQIGAGLTNLGGNSAAFTGTTTVEAGTLAVNGILGGTLNVLSAGRLQGSGTVGS